jgi:hypothetical protein
MRPLLLVSAAAAAAAAAGVSSGHHHCDCDSSTWSTARQLANCKALGVRTCEAASGAAAVASHLCPVCFVDGEAASACDKHPVNEAVVVGVWLQQQQQQQQQQW